MMMNYHSHPESVQLRNEREVIQSAGRQAIAAFLEDQTCFSILRPSSKVVVFDTRIPIQLAFYALVEHDMPAAPLWDPALCQFVGILTVTDFIDILRHFHQTKTPASKLINRSIADILNQPHMPKPGEFLSADSSTSLKQACLLLHRNGLDFLPIVYPEDMRVLDTVTYTTMLEHLVTHFREQRRLFDDLLIDLQLGTYHDELVTIQSDQTLAAALQLLHDHNLSALPVVQHLPSGKRLLVGVYSRSDVTFLIMADDAQQGLNNLDLTVGEILKHQEQQRDQLTSADVMHSCRKDQTLQNVFEYFSQNKFNRLYVVDGEHCLLGVVSARDLVAYFLEE